MNILIVTNRVPWPLQDGGAMCMYQSIKGYIDQDLNVSLLSMNTSKHHVNLPIRDTYFERLTHFETVNINNDVTFFGAFQNLFHSKSYVLSRFISAEFENRLIALIEETRPDVIQFETLFAAYYIHRIADRFPDTQMIYRMHNVEHQIWITLTANAKGLRKQYLNSISKRLKNEEIKVIQSADKILCISAEDQEWVRMHVGDKLTRIYPFAIDPRDFEIPQDRPVNFYHIGSMDWPPNVDAMQWWLSKIWPQFELSEIYPFYMAGRNMDKSVFENTDQKGVHILGEIESIDHFLADKSILVVPLRSGSGMRIKILEAMQRGIVVISTSLGATGIGGKPGEHYLLANTPEQFIAQMDYLVSHASALNDIAKSAQRLVLKEYALPDQIVENLNFFG